jgi:hypothetical protein
MKRKYASFERGLVLLSAILVALFIACATRADTVVFKNGDVVSGTIKSMAGGKMVVTTAEMGDITVDMADVKTFSTDEPIQLQLSDGTMINQKVTQGAEGTVTTAVGGAIAPQPVPLAEVAKINPPPATWTGALILNGMLTRGQTISTTFGVVVNADRRTDNDRILLAAGYNFGSQKVNGQESTTVDNWFARAEYDYFFTQKFYANIFGRVEKNRIIDLDLRLTPGAGVGYQWVEQPNLNFNTELGMAWVYQDYTNQPTAQENVSARAAYHVDATFFNGQLKLFNDVAVFPSVQNTSDFLMLSDIGGRLLLTKTMFAELRIEWDYNSQPAPSTARNNTQYTLGVGWTF